MRHAILARNKRKSFGGKIWRCHQFKFKYLGSILKNNGEINEDVTKDTNWNVKLQESKESCDNKVPTKFKKTNFIVLLYYQPNSSN